MFYNCRYDVLQMIVLKIYTELSPEQEEQFSAWCADVIGMAEEAAYEDSVTDTRYCVKHIVGEIADDDEYSEIVS